MLLRLALTLALVAAHECDTCNDGSIAFVQLGQELLKAPRRRETVGPSVQLPPAVHVPWNFGGLKKAGEAAEAEAISRGIQAFARYVYDSLSYTMPVTQALKGVQMQADGK
mmetsp:Transcript_137347/g.194343  ORF Transcript_137347/g.194343 Transcript_137347/m.194343 type:complete len:111 (+) Transcript_137347:29-361(+)